MKKSFMVVVGNGSGGSWWNVILVSVFVHFKEQNGQRAWQFLLGGLVLLGREAENAIIVQNDCK